MTTAADTRQKRKLPWFPSGPGWGVGIGLALLTVGGNCGGAYAEDDPPPLPTSLDAYRSGSLYSGLVIADRSTQEMEWDDFANPGMLWVDRAKPLWTQRDGTANRSCADCHGQPSSLAGVATRYPTTDPRSGAFFTLEDRINDCRQQQMQATPWPYESEALLGMTTLIKLQSRGRAVAVSISGANAPWFTRGEALYRQPLGQLGMSCQDCHEKSEGAYLRAEHLSQGHSNGFPTYRLKWQSLGSLQRRFRECNSNIRAAALPYGSDDYRALELYLAWRGNGLPLESPSVRK